MATPEIPRDKFQGPEKLGQKPTVTVLKETELPAQMATPENTRKPEVSSVQLQELQNPTQATIEHMKATVKHMRDFLPGALLRNDPITEIHDFVSTNYSSIMTTTARIAQQRLMAAGKSCPCSFMFGGLGSLARGEISPFSDLDFCLLIETDTKQNREYFEEMLGIMREIIVGLGESKTLTSAGGLQFCTGGLTPVYKKLESKLKERGGTPELLGTPRDLASLAYKPYRSKDVTIPSAAPSVLTVSLQEVGLLSGDKKLLDQFVMERDILYRELAEPEKKGSLTVRQEKALTYLQSGAVHMETVGELEKILAKDQGYVDVKTSLIRPIQGVVTGLCIFYGIEEPNTIKAIDLLVQRKILNPSIGGQLKLVYELGHTLRLKAQLMAQQEKDRVALLSSGPGEYGVTEEEKIKLKDCHRVLVALRQANQQFVSSKGTKKTFM